MGRVVGSIGEGIIKGRYPPGSLLPREPELIAKFGVSRTALREALKVLAAKGLVETRQRVGTRVRSQEQWNHFDPEITGWNLANGFRDGFVHDLIEFRQITEPAAARLAARRASVKDLAAIAAALEGMQVAAAEKDPAAYAEADARFHICVFLASHNNLMASLSFHHPTDPGGHLQGPSDDQGRQGLWLHRGSGPPSPGAGEESAGAKSRLPARPCPSSSPPPNMT